MNWLGRHPKLGENKEEAIGAEVDIEKATGQSLFRAKRWPCSMRLVSHVRPLIHKIGDGNSARETTEDICQRVRKQALDEGQQLARRKV